MTDTAQPYDGVVTMRTTPATLTITEVAERVKVSLAPVFLPDDPAHMVVGQGGPTGTILQMVVSNGTVTFAVDGIDLTDGTLLCTLLEDDRR